MLMLETEYEVNDIYRLGSVEIKTRTVSTSEDHIESDSQLLTIFTF